MAAIVGKRGEKAAEDKGKTAQVTKYCGRLPGCDCKCSWVVMHREGQELAPQQGWDSGLQCFEVLEGISGGVGGGCRWLSLTRDLVPRGFGRWAWGRVGGACCGGVGLVGHRSLR